MASPVNNNTYPTPPVRPVDTAKSAATATPDSAWRVQRAPIKTAAPTSTNINYSTGAANFGGTKFAEEGSGADGFYGRSVSESAGPVDNQPITYQVVVQGAENLPAGEQSKLQHLSPQEQQQYMNARNIQLERLKVQQEQLNPQLTQLLQNPEYENSARNIQGHLNKIEEIARSYDLSAEDKNALIDKQYNQISNELAAVNAKATDKKDDETTQMIEAMREEMKQDRQQMQDMMKMIAMMMANNKEEKQNIGLLDFLLPGALSKIIQNG